MSAQTEIAQANVETFDRYYDKPAWWFKWRYDTQVKRKTVLALLKSLQVNLAHKNVFELGFGAGEILFSFPRSAELNGVELSRSAVENARSRATARGYKKFNFTELKSDGSYPATDNSMDIVIASHVLEHIEDLEKCLSEIKRILRPGGILVVLIPINERFEDPHHCRKFTAGSCRRQCEGSGFTFVKGFENELLYYLVEKLYWSHTRGNWGPAGNLARMTFNILTAPLPFRVYRLLDRLIGILTKLPPRQAGLAFIKGSQ